MLECSYKNIKDAQDKCMFVQQNCEFQYFNLLTFNYCYINNFTPVTYLIIIIIILLCFYFLSTTGNDHLAPSLSIMSDKLGLSQNLAGLTLLALGNQAPDVIVAFVLGDSQDDEGVETAFGPLLGSGLMVVGFVLSTVIYLGKKVIVTPGHYTRDLLVYQISLIYVFYLGWVEKINLIQGIMFFVMYIIYVLIAFIMDKCQKNEGQDTENEADNQNKKEAIVEKEPSIKQSIHNQVVPKTKSKNENEEGDNEEKSETDIDEEDEESKKFDNELNNSKLKLEDIIQQSYLSIKSKNLSKIEQYSIIKRDLSRSHISWKKKSCLQRTIYVLIEVPFNFIRDLTIPPYEREKWKRNMFICQPIAIPIFLIVIFNLYSYIVPYWIIFTAIFGAGLILSGIIIATTHKSSLPRCEWLLLTLAFVLSILWLWSVSSILVDMIVTARHLLPIEIPQAFISLIVLAFGGALPDFIVDTSLAKTGYAEMAVAGTIGAPVFGNTFGMGLCVIKELLFANDHTLSFSLFNFEKNRDSKILIAGMAVVSAITIQLMVSGCILKFQITRVVAYIGYGLYATFVLLLVYFTFIDPSYSG